MCLDFFTAWRVTFPRFKTNHSQAFSQYYGYNNQNEI